jgi:hypothetical protein
LITWAEEIRGVAVIEGEEEMAVVEAEAGLAERNSMQITSGEQASCCKDLVVHVSVIRHYLMLLHIFEFA